MFRIQYLVNFGLHRLYTWRKPVQRVFINQFCEQVLRSASYPPDSVETIRKACYRNAEILTSQDFGAGTRAATRQRSIGDMARMASISKRFGILLYRMVSIYKPEKIIELGTGAGISTLYLASGDRSAKLITVEGNSQLAGVASENFKQQGFHNIIVINKPFDEVIERLKSEIINKTLIYIDGNHTYEATLRYYDAFAKIPGCAVILIFDDINWSAGMMRAWKRISGSENIGLAFDLFHMGIVFQGYGVSGQKIKLWYS